MFLSKNVIIKGLWYKTAQECDSKGVMRDFGVSVEFRRVFEGCGGGGPSIHAERCIAHKRLLVKYLDDVCSGVGSY